MGSKDIENNDHLAPEDVDVVMNYYQLAADSNAAPGELLPYSAFVLDGERIRNMQDMF